MLKFKYCEFANIDHNLLSFGFGIFFLQKTTKKHQIPTNFHKFPSNIPRFQQIKEVHGLELTFELIKRLAERVENIDNN